MVSSSVSAHCPPVTFHQSTGFLVDAHFSLSSTYRFLEGSPPLTFMNLLIVILVANVVQ